MKRKSWIKSTFRPASCVRRHDEKAPTPNLAYSPSDMARMYEHGMPVNSTNLVGNFSDGSKNVHWSDLSIERKRGVDVADIWTASKQARAKLTKSLKNAKLVNS